MDDGGGEGALLTVIHTVAETGSTNADMIALAATGTGEGVWLRAERQLAGKGRQGRVWTAPAGNFSGSTIVRLRPTDPPAASLALVAAVALHEAVSVHLPSPFRGSAAPSLALREREGARPAQPGGKGEGSGLVLKWPNDLLLAGAKLSGVLLERAGDAVVIGIGVNLAAHPDLADRSTTSLAAHGAIVDPADFAETLAEAVERWVGRWRGEGIAPVRTRWLAHAHAVGTALAAALPDGARIDGLFDGLDADGALILRLADGQRRVMHAADIFLI